MKKMKNVLTAGIVGILAFALTACVKDETTGETSFSPIVATQKAVSAVANIPDETKATVLEGLAWLLGATGVGVCAIPALKAGSTYFRNKRKTSTTVAEDDSSAVDDTNDAV